MDSPYQLKKKNVQFINEVAYTKIDDQGLHYVQNGKAKILDVDHIVICAGQTPLRELYDALSELGKKVHMIGGADVAAELDAKEQLIKDADWLLKSNQESS